MLHDGDSEEQSEGPPRNGNLPQPSSILRCFPREVATGVLCFLLSLVFYYGTVLRLQLPQTNLLDLSMLALPLSSVVSAVAVIYLYCVDASSTSYWWYALPLVCAVLYVVFASSLSRPRS